MKARGATRLVLATLAVGYLAYMFVSGSRPTSEQFVAFEAAGVMTQVPEHVQRVALVQGGRHWTFERVADTWRLDDAPLTGTAAAHLTLAVKFLHTARPVRELPTPATQVGDPAFGLTAPALALVVTLQDGTRHALAFGAHNPDGSLQYMRAGPPPRDYLMSNFVGEEWGALAAALAAAQPVQ